MEVSRLSREELLKVKINFLVCSLRTLSPNDKTFKNFNPKPFPTIGIDNGSTILAGIEDLVYMNNLLNKTSLRQFSDTLIKPVFEKEVFLSKVSSKKLYKKTTLFKKYLKKFKHAYSRYFYCKISNYNEYPSDKEINTLALMSLLLIVGV